MELWLEGALKRQRSEGGGKGLGFLWPGSLFFAAAFIIELLF